MVVPAKVRDLVDSLGMQGDQTASYLDRGMGEVHVISHVALQIAEGGTDADDVPWYAFRGEALRRIAIEWCKEHATQEGHAAI